MSVPDPKHTHTFLGTELPFERPANGTAFLASWGRFRLTLLRSVASGEPTGTVIGMALMGDRNSASISIRATGMSSAKALKALETGFLNLKSEIEEGLKMGKVTAYIFFWVARDSGEVVAVNVKSERHPTCALDAYPLLHSQHEAPLYSMAMKNAMKELETIVAGSPALAEIVEKAHEISP